MGRALVLPAARHWVSRSPPCRDGIGVLWELGLCRILELSSVLGCPSCCASVGSAGTLRIFLGFFLLSRQEQLTHSSGTFP